MAGQTVFIAQISMNQIEQLKQFTKVVADSGDFASIKEFAPQDATTNPSLILAAANIERYHDILDHAVTDLKGSSLTGAALTDKITDKILINFGVEILKIVPGRVSTETDARLSFDTEALIKKGRELIAGYKEQGIERERVLIKIAATWEGIRAAEVLQKDGIRTNLTLMFSVVQAAACAEAKVQLISPFVGRIMDWHKKITNIDYHADEDPGVLSTSKIYNYLKKYGYPMEVMGASFRNTGEILELAGCDLLTISPKLLAVMQKSTEPVTRKLSPEKAQAMKIDRVATDEKSFRWIFNEDAMATEKTSEGIRLFAADSVKLDKKIAELLAA